MITGRQAEIALTGPGATKTIADTVTRNIFTGRVTIVESKFTFSPRARPSLTKAQQKARTQLPNYEVNQTTGDTVGKITGTPGGEGGYMSTNPHDRYEPF